MIAGCRAGSSMPYPMAVAGPIARMSMSQRKSSTIRFVRWSGPGIFEGLFSVLAGAEDASDRLFIDSSA